MRLHSDVLTERDIYDACRISRTYAPIFTRYGSRSHDHAFEVQLSGSSPYRSQGHGEYAATWDEWGVFFAVLFDRDPNMLAGNKSWGYQDSDDFHAATTGRFSSVGEFPANTHPRHKWMGTGDGESQACTKCGARFVWKR